MTKISIKNLKLETIIGIEDWERQNKQSVIVNLDVRYDSDKAVMMDNIKLAVDYQALTDEIVSHVEESYYLLLEKLADSILDIVLHDPLIEEAVIRIDKPQALERAESVSVEMSRKRHE